MIFSHPTQSILQKNVLTNRAMLVRILAVTIFIAVVGKSLTFPAPMFTIFIAVKIDILSLALRF